MLFQALVRSASAQSELDLAALAAHAAMLEHGFLCTGATERGAPQYSSESSPTNASAVPLLPPLVVGADGAVSLQILPAGWKSATGERYSFAYNHPLKGPAEDFSMKCIAIGSSLAVHAASSVPGTDLLTVTLDASQSLTADAAPSARATEWQDKTAASIARKLLARHDSILVTGTQKSLQVSNTAASDRERPAASVEYPPPRHPSHNDGSDMPWRSPFGPVFPGQEPSPVWMPQGGGSLLGPRHPAWGGGLPGRFGGGAGMMPRFDPVGPGLGEPDPDHMPVFPGFQPGFQGGASGRGPGRLDPDGMFMM